MTNDRQPIDRVADGLSADDKKAARGFAYGGETKIAPRDTRGCASYGAANAKVGPRAARTQDFLYGEDGLPC
jgi:hypothetical protein